MSTKQELEGNEATPIQYKRQKLDTNPVDNDTPIEISPISSPIAFSKLEEPIEVLDSHIFNNHTISEELDKLNINYVDPEFIRRFCFAFKKNHTFIDETSQAAIYNLPFSTAILPNLFDGEFLSNV